MERFMHPWRSAILLLLSQELELYAAVNHEGRAFQKFREEEVDPLGALADWNGEGVVCQRSWFGVGCTDGRVMDLERSSRTLGLAARLRIAMRVTYCLDHIQQLNPRVVIKTLDSSSICPTDDYAAKFSDLGFWSESEETKSPPHGSGYLEVAMTEPVNSVYDFGLLLIEILSGKIPSSKKDMLHEN